MKPMYFKMIVMAGLLSLACTTRVSEWVLLNAVTGKYSLVYYHDGPLSESLKKQNKEISESIRSANIQFRTVMRHDIKKPYYELYYKDRFFSRYYDHSLLKNLTVSPMREKVAAELMAGNLCVMVYLKTDNKEKDDRGLVILKNTVKSSPFGKIITVIELSRNSIDESHFASLLLNVEDDLRTIQEPMLFGVFGRFKALEPLVGKGISEENINLMIDFLTAECSCLIKDDLPGTDILFTDRWENPQPALLNQIIDANPILGQ
jgi:hypothetical protein